VTVRVPLELVTATRGRGDLTVTLTNVSTDPVPVWWEVEGPEGPLYDCLSVELTRPGAKRTLLLTGDRNASTVGRVVLAPRAGRSAELDLAAWADAPVNGLEALAAGEYSATVRYRCDEPDCWRGELAAAPVSVHLPG
jgi:hypothetical protein